MQEVLAYPRRWLAQLRDLRPRNVLIAGFTAFMVYGFPGYMSTDSVAQLVQARTLTFSDGHPPLMAAEWALLDRIVSGPLLMLLLQGTLMFGGTYAMFCRVLDKRHAAWTTVGLLLFPPVLTTMAVIWKDSQMAALLVCGTACLVQERRRWRLVGIGFFLAACLMRHNAFVAAFPIIGLLFEWRAPLPWWKRLGLMVGAAVVAVLALFGASRLIAKEHIRLTPAFHDINGVIACGRDRSDEELRHVLRGTSLVVHTGIQAHARKLFELRGAWRVVSSDDRLFSYPDTEQEWVELNRAWKELVLDEPTAYIAAHWAVFQSVLGIDDVPRAPVYDVFLEEPGTMVEILHNASPSFAQQLVARTWFYWLANNTPLFRPYIYAAIALLLLALCCRDRLTFALLVSGLLYELSFWPAFAEPDFRYSHWMITTTCFAAVILFVQRRRTTS